MTEPFHPLRSQAPLIVYLDVKSPYAYLAIAPTRALAAEIGIEVDWRPLTLDIPSYLGSARTDDRGEVVESERSPGQWARVRYAYGDAKRYARLRGVTILGTRKIWNSAFAGMAMDWAKDADVGAEATALDRTIDLLFERFWKRELDIEDPEVIVAVLSEAGVATDGFREHARGPGRQAYDERQQAIFAAGIFGVPTFVVGDALYFGREHLPRIGWELAGRMGPAPDVANRLDAVTPIAPTTTDRSLTVAVDFKSAASFLALAPTRTFARDHGLAIDWQPFVVPPPKVFPPPSPSDDRGRRHRRLRAEYLDAEAVRYGAARGVALEARHAAADSSVALMGLLYAKQQASEAITDAYVEAVFERVWGNSLDLEDTAAIGAVLAEVGAGDGFAAFAQAEGRAELERAARELDERGVFNVPTFVVGSETFFGRQHFALIAARMGLRTT